MNTCRTLNYLLKNRNNRGVYSLQLKHTSNRGGILYGLSFNVKPIILDNRSFDTNLALFQSHVSSMRHIHTYMVYMSQWPATLIVK